MSAWCEPIVGAQTERRSGYRVRQSQLEGQSTAVGSGYVVINVLKSPIGAALQTVAELRNRASLMRDWQSLLQPFLIVACLFPTLVGRARTDKVDIGTKVFAIRSGAIACTVRTEPEVGSGQAVG